MNILNKYTFQTLIKNKIRTIVTIIGIILSVAMITAVTTSISSFKSYMIKQEISDSGEWQGIYNNVSVKQSEKVCNSDKVKQSGMLQNIGYAKVDGIKNSDKPFLFIGGMGEGYKDICNVELKEGRMPENKDEIIVPDSLLDSGGLKLTQGQSINVEIGKRERDGELLGQNINYDSTSETFVSKLSKTYTVVGTFKSLKEQSFLAPGYTALTVIDSSIENEQGYDVYFTLKNPKEIYDFIKETLPDANSGTHKNLLQYMGISSNDQFNRVLYTMAAILIAIIVIGSVCLIYNSFSISVGERTKEFGLLSSIGATRKQLRKSILFEASSLSIVGIPLGVVAGIFGMWVTFKCLGGKLSFLTARSDSINMPLTLNISWKSVIVAAILGFVTVLISSIIPAKRALHMSAIEAIRQSNDIKIKSKKIKTSKLTKKLFGLEGTLATKNFKRNRKKYRATVISLFVSIVLFITATSYTMVLSNGMKNVMGGSNIDLLYQIRHDSTPYEEIYNTIRQTDGVDKVAYFSLNLEEINVNENQLNKEYRQFATNNDLLHLENGNQVMGCYLCCVNDDYFNEMVENDSLIKENYYDKDNPKCVMLDNVLSRHKGKYYKYQVFNGDSSFQFTTIKDEDSEQSDSNEQITINSLGRVNEKQIFSDISSKGITFVYPESMIKYVTKSLTEQKQEENTDDEDMDRSSYLIQAHDHSQTYKNLKATLGSKGLSTSMLFDYAANEESSKALMFIVNVFSYGFIILISLITMANVFNTMSTNIMLRRREFAMLKSVGMTSKGFNKMMNFECLLYGFKSLIFGLPVGIILSLLIQSGMSQAYMTNIMIPWTPILIASVAVFITVFATMIYSMSKIKKQNTIDALKNENI